MDVSDAPELEPEDGEDSEEQDDEGGDDAEPDAPSAVEHNEGMSTVLSADTLDGVQSNAGDE